MLYNTLPHSSVELAWSTYPCILPLHSTDRPLVQSRQINQTTPKRCLWGYYIPCYTSAVLSCTSELLPRSMPQRQLVLAPHAYHETFPCQVAPCKVERGLSTKLTRTVSGTTLRTVVSSQPTDLPH